MHIPDGLLTTEIWLIMWLLAAIILGYSIRKTNKKLTEKHVPLLGVLAAFIFAAQMLNTHLEIVFGVFVSGHMLGGVLAAVFLGPLTASIIVAAVFILQALLHTDGGITTLGANIFNMGLIGTIGGYYVYYTIKNAAKGDSGRFLAIAVAAWLAVVLASAATAMEIAASGIIDLSIILPLMVVYHSVVGLIEAGLTLAVVGYVLKTRPDLLEMEKV